MSISDYPDFLRVEQWVGAPFVNALQIALPPDQPGFNFYTASWESVEFYVFQSGGGAATPIQLTLSWYDGPGGAFLGSQVYQMLAGMQMRDVVPVTGAYLNVGLNGWVGTRNVYLQVVPRRGTLAETFGAGWLPMLGYINVAVAGGGNKVTNADRVQTGPATLAVFSSGVNWFANLFELDLAGVAQTLLGTLGNAGGRSASPVTVRLPTRTVQLQVFNQDAGAANFYAGLCPARV